MLKYVYYYTCDKGKFRHSVSAINKTESKALFKKHTEDKGYADVEIVSVKIHDILSDNDDE